jgi:hypothetical protein
VPFCVRKLGSNKLFSRVAVIVSINILYTATTQALMVTTTFETLLTRDDIPEKLQLMVSPRPFPDSPLTQKRH